MKKVKLFGLLALATLTVGGSAYSIVSANEPSAETEAAHSDAWEEAANKANSEKSKADKATPSTDQKAPETKKEETGNLKSKDEKGNVIDENYVKKQIDTPTGAEEKAKEDKYLDSAEKKTNEALKKQEAKKEVKKTLPNTAAVK